MAIHRYFFWIEDSEIEVYKNGKSVLYRGEKKIDYSQGIEEFFENWKENSAYISGEEIDFTFIGKKEENLEKFKEFCEKFPANMNTPFTFENLKQVINEKELKKFCVKVGEKEYCLQKTEFNYNRITKNMNLEKIYILGNNIQENFLSEGVSDMEVQTKNIKESGMASFFRSKLKV